MREDGEPCVEGHRAVRAAGRLGAAGRARRRWKRERKPRTRRASRTVGQRFGRGGAQGAGGTMSGRLALRVGVGREVAPVGECVCGLRVRRAAARGRGLQPRLVAREE